MQEALLIKRMCRREGVQIGGKTYNRPTIFSCIANQVHLETMKSLFQSRYCPWLLIGRDGAHTVTSSRRPPLNAIKPLGVTGFVPVLHMRKKRDMFVELIR